MIIFQATARRAVCLSDDPITTGSAGIQVRFTFSDDWDDVAGKVAVFKAGELSVDVLLEGDSCAVPSELLAEPGEMLRIGVYGADGEGTLVIPTVYADAGLIRRGAEPSGIEPTPEQGTLLDQLLAALAAAMEHAPKIEGGYWFVWNAETGAYVDTEVRAAGTDGSCVWVASYVSAGAGSSGRVILANMTGPLDRSPQIGDVVFAPPVGETGTASVLYQISGVALPEGWTLRPIGSLQGPPGQPGSPGAAGFAPAVTIETIPGGHRLTITSAAHPEGQSIDILDGTGGGGSITVDDALSDSSENPVQNKVVKAALDNKLGKTGAGSNVTVSFSQAEQRTAIATGEKLSVLFGKILKWLSDLGTAAFRAATGSISQDSTDLVESGAVFSALADKYVKPAGGIPGSDLAETYLKEHQSLAAYRTAAAQDVIDQQIAAGIPTKTSDLQNDSGFLSAHQDISGKADKVQEITVSGSGTVTQALDAGKAYHFTGVLTALTITLNAAASGQRAQYHFDFTAGSTAPTVTIPNTVTMPAGFQVEANKRYEIDVLDGYGVAQSWEVSA